MLNMVELLKSEHINMWTSVLPSRDEFDDVHKDYKCLASVAKKSHDRNACTCVKWCINTRLFIAAISIIAKGCREPLRFFMNSRTSCINYPHLHNGIYYGWIKEWGSLLRLMEGKLPGHTQGKIPSLFTLMCIVCCFLWKSFKSVYSFFPLKCYTFIFIYFLNVGSIWAFYFKKF